jgi:hypothetical protein
LIQEDNKRLQAQVDAAAAKERERKSREYWGETGGGEDDDEEGILPLEDGDVVKIIRPGSPSGSGGGAGGGSGGAGGGGDSRPSSGSGSRPGSASILRRPGSGASSRPGSAPADDKRSRQVTYWRDKKVNAEEERAAPPPAAKLGSVEAEVVAAKRLERIAKEKEDNDPQMQKLNELIRLMQQHNLPGVDPNSISAVKRNIGSGRFPHQHYIVLFTKRLEDKGIDLEVRDAAAAAAAAARRGLYV